MKFNLPTNFCFVAVLFVSTFSFSADAQILDIKKLKIPFFSKSNNPVVDRANLSFTERISDPVEGKIGEQLSARVNTDAKKLQRVNGYTINTLRSGEVIKVTIPASYLFPPNERTLLSNAALSLWPLLRLMENDLYETVITAHTDDTGSKKYLTGLSADRVRCVESWYKTNMAVPVPLYTYAFGSDKPLFSNDSETNRARNRRIAIYFIPNENMLKAAKKKKL